MAKKKKKEALADTLTIIATEEEIKDDRGYIENLEARIAELTKERDKYDDRRREAMESVEVWREKYWCLKRRSQRSNGIRIKLTVKQLKEAESLNKNVEEAHRQGRPGTTFGRIIWSKNKTGNTEAEFEIAFYPHAQGVVIREVLNLLDEIERIQG